PVEGKLGSPAAWRTKSNAHIIAQSKASLIAGAIDLRSDVSIGAIGDRPTAGGGGHVVEDEQARPDRSRLSVVARIIGLSRVARADENFGSPLRGVGIIQPLDASDAEVREQ